MNILIIGGTGFLGQYLVQELHKNSKHSITVASRGTKKDYFIPINNFKNVKIVSKVDTLNSKSLNKHFKNIDVVFNLAGLISFKQKDRDKLVKINHEGTLNVLNACEKNKIKKLIHISSTAALGFNKYPISEQHNFNWSKYKRLVYSKSKSLSNKDLLESKVDCLIVYPPLILGPGDKTNTYTLLNALQKGQIKFNTPGSNSIIDVRDLASALVLLLKAKTKHKQFIISGGHYSIKELNSISSKVLEIKPPKIKLPKVSLYALLGPIWIFEKLMKNPPLTYEMLFLSFQKRHHNFTRIKKLGYEPKYTLEETIQDSAEWMEDEE